MYGIKTWFAGGWLVMVAAIMALGNRASAAEPSTGAAGSVPPPLDMTAEQDHRAMMEQLQIRSLRPGANPNDPQAPNAVTYDEAKANPYPALPDPLLLKNGQRVSSAEMWWTERRPEIVEDFDREVYGRVPHDAPRVTWEVIGTTREMKGVVPVVTNKLVGHVDNSAYPAITVEIDLTLTTPANAKGPVPVVLEFGFNFPPGFGRRGPGQIKGVRTHCWIERINES